MPDNMTAPALASRMVEEWLRRTADVWDLPDCVPDEAEQAVRAELVALADVFAARPPFHVIDFAEHGWTIMHPLVGCGQDLFGCPVNEAAENGLERPGRFARYRCDVDEDGLLEIGVEVSTS